MLARGASYDKKTLARQVIPLTPGYRTALSSRPELVPVPNRVFENLEERRKSSDFSYGSEIT